MPKDPFKQKKKKTYKAVYIFFSQSCPFVIHAFHVYCFFKRGTHKICSAQSQCIRNLCSPQSYLLGLLAKIKCSICSYQLNLWYVTHGVTRV